MMLSKFVYFLGKLVTFIYNTGSKFASFVVGTARFSHSDQGFNSFSFDLEEVDNLGANIIEEGSLDQATEFTFARSGRESQAESISEPLSESGISHSQLESISVPPSAIACIGSDTCARYSGCIDYPSKVNKVLR